MGARIQNIPTNLVYERTSLGIFSIDNFYNPSLDTITYTGNVGSIKDKNINTAYVIKGQANGGRSPDFTIVMDYTQIWWSTQAGLIFQYDVSGGVPATGNCEVRVSPTDPAPSGIIVGNYPADYSINNYVAAITPAMRYIYIRCTGTIPNSWVELTLRETMLIGSG